MKYPGAKKSFGQHFLNNDQIAMGIVDALVDELAIPNVLEVGPGRGVLTHHLIDKNVNLKVVEADRDMVSVLSKTFPDLVDNIIFEDFLKTPIETLFDGEEFGLIGNYPYNISSQILFKMVQYRDKIPLMVGMFQKEVADRVVSKEGSKVYGVVSVLIQAYYDCEYVFTVPPESFDPPPKVMSAVIKLRRKENHNLPCDESLFKSIVKISFGQRRKMLRNTMKQFVNSSEDLTDPLFTKRPEQLSLEDFVSLTQRIEALKKI